LFYWLFAIALQDFYHKDSGPKNADKKPLFITQTNKLVNKTGIKASPWSWDFSWIDYNNDDYLDLFVTGHGTSPYLYKNNGNKTFSRIDWKFNSSDRHGFAWGDFNNDNQLDLFITVGAQRGLGSGKNELYKFYENGHIKQLHHYITIDKNLRGRNVSWIDYDNDGDLDLFLANFRTPIRLLQNNNARSFKDISNTTNIKHVPYIAHWVDFDNDRKLDLIISYTDPDKLWSFMGHTKIAIYKNNGDGTFVDIAEEKTFEKTC